VQDPLSLIGDAAGRRISDLRDEIDREERVLLAASSKFRREQRATGVRGADVIGALPADAVLVSFVRYTEHDDVPHYLAFVQNRTGGDPAVLPLRAPGDDRRPRGEVEIAGVEPPAGAATRLGSSAPIARPRSRFGEAIWDLIERRSGDARMVFIVPGWSVNLVNFATLLPRRAPETYLLEGSRVFHFLSAERDLVPDPEPPSVAGPPSDQGTGVTKAPDGDAIRQPARMGK
jgi:hypothetical protein